MLWLILLLMSVMCLMVLRWRNRKFHKIHKQLPTGIPPVPILGHALTLLGNAQDRMNEFKRLGRDVVDNHGGISSLWFGHKFFVVLADPEALEVVMKSCLEKDDILNVTRILLGYGSIFAPVSIWRPRRKMLVPTFGQKTLNNFVTTFSAQGAVLTDQLDLVAGNVNFSIIEKIAKYTMDTVCENVLGVKINAQSIKTHPVPLAFSQFCLLTASRIVRPWLFPDAIYKWTRDYPQSERTSKILKEFVVEIIKTKRNAMALQKIDSVNEENSKPKCLLELMIEAGLTDLEIQEESLVMLLAGTDTSAITSSFLCLLLAKHQEIQEKVYQEIKEVIGDSDRHIAPSDLPNLRYLDAVLRETLRMFPPAPITVRKVDKNVTLPSGLTLVPGMGVLLHIWATHRNQKYWGSDVDVFRPERFLEGPLKHPYAFLAFSNGQRGCIGYQYSMMLLKTLMVHIVRRYRILPSSSADNTCADDELPTTFEIMLKHAHNFEVQIELRNK